MLVTISTYKANGQEYYLIAEHTTYQHTICETERLMPMTAQEAVNYIRQLCTITFCRFVHIPLAIKVQMSKVY